MTLWRSIALFLLLIGQLTAATLPFQFTLDEDATTSAGVFTPDGTLVRTLWRKVDFTRGDHTSTWDGLTDEQAAAPAGSYSVRVLSHHLDYIWQGAIGNTSTAQYGPTVHRGFRPLRDLTISGTNAFYITGYVEGDYDFRQFLTNDIQRVNDHWCWYRNTDGTLVSQTGNIFTPEWVATDTDGTWVYFAAPDSTNPVTRVDHSGPGFIVASDVSTHQSVSFTNGAPIENGPANFLPFANGIKVGSVKGVSGIAVEKTGSTLAVSVRPENKIYLVHKRTGAAIRTISVPSPGALSFSPNGDLWTISGTSLCRITTPATTPNVSTPVSNLQEPLDLAVDPNGAFVVVVDAGSSQQVKAFSTTGSPILTFGQAGGYAANGPDVTHDKFLFLDREGKPGGSIAIGPDGSFWLSDVGNRRLLHFAADRTYLEEIMFQNVSYSTSVDANNPTRVFSDFLEFSVDYSKPLAQGWKLVRNWGANLPVEYFDFGCGVRQVTTLSNGRTYGAVAKKDVPGEELVELTAQGTRLTNIPFTPTKADPGTFETLTPTGALRRGHIYGDSGTTATFEEKPLLGFDDQNNPLWGSYTTLATAPATSKDPLTRCCSLGDFRMPSTTTDILISFDATKNNGWHLGGVRKGGSDWLWKASPTVSTSVPLDGLGSFDIGDNVNYPGNTVFTSGRNVIFGYHGEFWADHQACQFMHFYDDGLFVGQFGESSLGHESFEGVIPGLAGNSAFSFVTEVNGKIYLWANDESQHGPQRWLLDGAQTIRETTATGTLGQTQMLVIPVAPNPFPTGVAVQSGDGRVSFTWNPVADAKSYNVKLATSRGGIATLIAGGVESTGKTIANLTNGQTYYFSVSAVTNHSESVDSTPVAATPASLTSLVEVAGRYDQAGAEPSKLQVNGNQIAVGKPVLTKLSPLLGNLTLRDIGSAGYRIFSWSASNLTDSINLLPGNTIEPKSGWRTDGFLNYQFSVNNVPGSISGLYVVNTGTRKGTIDITPQHAGVYYLTVVMPARFHDAATYKVRISPKDQTLPSVGYDTTDTVGISHIYQFRFQGPVTLTIESISGIAAVQAVFLDEAGLIPQETTGFQLWQQQNFSSTDLANASLTGMLADFDRDGQSNLLEYALGTSPVRASRSAILTNILNWLGTDYLTLQFTRDYSVHDVTMRVGASSDLTNPSSWVWIDPDDLTYRISDLLDVPAKGLETIIVRDVLPAGAGPRFMRLSVGQP
ncbi:MAG: FlgD immunoglobulin-like domain containing protein [Chthoniobacterales bacterium]